MTDNLVIILYKYIIIDVSRLIGSWYLLKTLLLHLSHQSYWIMQYLIINKKKMFLFAPLIYLITFVMELLQSPSRVFLNVKLDIFCSVINVNSPH